MLDAETDPFLHGRVPKAFLWDVFDGEKHYTYESVKDVIAFLSDKNWIVYAHNGGKFDYLLPGFLDELAVGSRVQVINGRLAKFKIGECEFRDSVNILPIKLADYQKEKIDYAKFEKDVRKTHIKEITDYLHKDTEYLYKIVMEFRETYGDGLTLAGSAMKFWQNQTNLNVTNQDGGFFDAMAPFYYGGRCECFHVGMIDGLFEMRDINSAYPRAMLDDHPFSLGAFEASAKVTDPVIPQSFYHVLATSRGAFPARMGDGSLRFPDQKGLFWVTGWELQAGLDTGTVDLHRVITRYDSEERVNFRRYIEHFYEMKKDAGANEGKQSARYIFAKLFMNSLYGKFGANPNEYEEFRVFHQSEKSGLFDENGREYQASGNISPELCVAGRPLEAMEKRFYRVNCAASITGWVRAFLWRQICAIRKAGGEVLYCDTDSIVYRDGGSPTFQIGEELGEWSVEKGSPFCMGGIAGKKLYAFGNASGKWKKSCKGVDLEPAQILEVCKGAVIEYKRAAPSLSYTKRITGDAERDAKKLFVSRKTQLTGKTG